MHDRPNIPPKNPQERAHRDAETHKPNDCAGSRDGRQRGRARNVYAHFPFLVPLAVLVDLRVRKEPCWRRWRQGWRGGKSCTGRGGGGGRCRVQTESSDLPADKTLTIAQAHDRTNSQTA